MMIYGSEKFIQVIIIDQSPIGHSHHALILRLILDYCTLIYGKSSLKHLHLKNVDISLVDSVSMLKVASKHVVMELLKLRSLFHLMFICPVKCVMVNVIRETLDVRYKNKNIYEVLNMTEEEALDYFENIPRIHKKLKTLDD